MGRSVVRSQRWLISSIRDGDGTEERGQRNGMRMRPVGGGGGEDEDPLSATAQHAADGYVHLISLTTCPTHYPWPLLSPSLFAHWC
jgi:hypothetical protein